jgi:ABC-type Zn uptake system ZnuABC Zn-binding protein ZnuA
MLRARTAVALVAALSSAVLLAQFGCKRNAPDDTWTKSEVRVAVSFPALYCFAANVVGDVGRVKSIKSTQGAHGSEVTAADRQLAESADVLFINGLGLDDTFVKKLRETSANTGLKVVNLGGRLPHDLLLESDGQPCGHGDEAHTHGDHDPHVWLGPDPAIRFVKLIARDLGELYPQHKATFDRNAGAYVKKLEELRDEGRAKLSGTPKAERKIVTVHGAMNYLARAFDVTIAGVVQTTPGKEPSADELKKLIAVCQKEKVRVIAAEPQFTTGGAVRVLRESLGGDIAVIELDPLETATTADLKPDWYEMKMKANLDALAKVFGK